MITKDVIQKIFETSRIDEVVGEFVLLKKRGINMIGLCPFHNEKTPSFTVSPAKNIFKCFGCSKGGNAVNFLMDHEHYSYPEALKYLANKYGIEIEEEQLSDEDKKIQNEKEVLYNLLSFAEKYFNQILTENNEGKAIGLSYLKERGFNDETIANFKLGYCTDKWDDFSKHAKQNGYSDSQLEKSGMSILKDKRLYDRYRGRIIFPIHNLSGRILGFSGRILTSDKKKAKYVNSPESEIYHKGKVLYGLYQAKSNIISSENCLVVEGNTDVLSMHQAGIKNVVAASGTAFTTDQIRLIGRYTKTITLLFDGDEAGKKASFKSGNMILEEGFNAKIVLFKEGEDPDSLCQKHSNEEVLKIINDKTQDFIIFKTTLLQKEAKNDPIKKANIVNDIVNSISLIPDGITRTIYIKECSNILNIPEQTIANATNKIIRTKIKKGISKTKDADVPTETIIKNTDEKQNISSRTDSEYQEKKIISLLLNYGSELIETKVEETDGKEQTIKMPLATYMNSLLSDETIYFSNPSYKMIFNEYKSFTDNDRLPSDEYFINHENDHITQISVELMSERNSLSPNWEKMHSISVTNEINILCKSAISTINSLKLKIIEKKLQVLEQEIINADNDEALIILNKIMKLNSLKKAISSFTGRVIN